MPAGYRGAWESRLSLLRPRDPAVPVEHRIEEGDPAAAILRVAGETASDLIVMGRRKAGLGRLLGRGVSGRVSREASCPVLALTPPDLPDARDQMSGFSRRGNVHEYRTILHPTDFSAPAAYALGSPATSPAAPAATCS